MLIITPPGPIRTLQDPLMMAEDHKIWRWLKENPPSSWKLINVPDHNDKAIQNEPSVSC